MTVVDAAFLLLLAVVMPVFSAISFRRYVRRARAGIETPRPQLYRETQLIEWSLCALLVLIWLYFDRAWRDLGITPPAGAGFWIAVLIAFLLSAYFAHGWRSARTLDNEARRKQRDALGDLVYMVPRTRGEYRHFIALSVTAGIVEELLYRGFLFWLLGQWMPVWGALLVSSIIFGLGHSYQGFAGVLRIATVGLVFGSLYWLSGSIWVPVVFHAAMDILQGAMLLQYWRDADIRTGKSAGA